MPQHLRNWVGMLEDLPTTGSARKQRSDAQQNRVRILRTAQQAFVQHGAAVAMDDIARQSGVGSGTLYRHFPTREVLIEAVYKEEVEKLTATAAHLLKIKTPIDALRTWMLLLIDHVASKRLILPALESVAGGSSRLVEGSHEAIHAAFLSLVENAQTTGALRAELQSHDLVRAMLGVFFTTAWPGWEESARRIVDLLLEGALMRPGRS